MGEVGKRFAPDRPSGRVRTVIAQPVRAIQSLKRGSSQRGPSILPMRRPTNASEQYSDGYAYTNQVKSFFSRLRNMIQGHHHGVSPKYLHQYANHSAWLEDNRRTDNGTLAKVVVSNAMGSPVSRSWK